MDEKDREKAMQAIWKKTPKDYRSMWQGQRSILVMRAHGTTIVPLVELTNDELNRLRGSA